MCYNCLAIIQVKEYYSFYNVLLKYGIAHIIIILKFFRLSFYVVGINIILNYYYYGI